MATENRSAAIICEPVPSLEELQPAAVRCWERVRAVLPPTDPTDPDDPSVALDTLMAMLHASLAMPHA
jgi:hypothetical protein